MNDTADAISPPDDLVIGATAISKRAFGGVLTPMQVYRLGADGWPIFRVRGKLACRLSAMRAEIERREQVATGRAA